MPYTIPEYIEIKATDGSAVAFLSPESDGVVAWIDDEQNATCTIEIELPLACEKWAYLTDKYRIYADDKEFVILNPDAVDKQRDGKKLKGKIKAHESWTLLGKKFQTISNDPQNPNPPWGAVIIVSGGAAQGGFDPGSAGSALSYLLNGTGWAVGTVDVTGTYDLETEKESVLYNINQVQEKWGGILIWDSVNKTVSLRDEETYQPYTGYQIRYAKNLKGINRVDDYDIVTRLYPFGENDLNIANVNGGLLYLDNQSYSTQVLEGVWYNQDLADQTQLKAQAEKQLAVMCKPRHNYKTEVLDLRSLPGYGHETFKRSDMADLFDEDFGANARVRIIRYRHNVFQPWLCDMELGDPIEKISATVAQTVLMAKFYKNVVKPNESFQNLLKAIINTAATEINGASGDYTLVDGVSTWFDRDDVTGELTGKLLRITPQGLIISYDGGQTWKLAISGEGIHADAGWIGKLNAGVVTIGAETTFAPGYDPTQITADSVGMGVDADCLGLWHFDGSLNSHKGVAVDSIDNYTKLLLHMDGADNGTTFTDECGKTVTRYGAVTKTGTKKFGTASGRFDGTDDYLSLADSEDWYFGSGDFTIDCWVKRGTTGTYQYIMGRGNSQLNGNVSFLLRFDNTNKISAFFSTNGSTFQYDMTTSSAYTDTNWHHLALVRNGVTITLYVDGISEGSVNMGTDTIYNSSTILCIGRAGEMNRYYFNGYLDELRISKGIARWTSNFTPPGAPYSRFGFGAGCFGQALDGYVKTPTTGLSPSQGTVNFRAKNLSASANGSVLVDLPKSDNTQGIKAGISSATGHEGELCITDLEKVSKSYVETTQSDFNSGTLTDVTATSAGDLELAQTMGKALSFDGVDDYVDIGSSLQSTSQMTIEGKIKLDDYSTERNIISNNLGAGTAQYAMRIGTNGKLTAAICTTSKSFWVTDVCDIEKNTEIHLASVINSTNNTYAVYKNGNIVASGTLTDGSHSLGTGKTFIGKDNRNESYFDGIIDDVRIWNVARTQQQIQDNMNKELAGNEPGLVGYWKFNEGTGTAAYDSTANGNNGTINGATWTDGLVPSSYKTPGTREKIVDLSSANPAGGTKIEWLKTTPTGTAVKVETALSTDGGSTYGAYQEAASGSSIPGIASDTNLSNARLKIKETLSTTDTNITPKLHSLTFNIWEKQASTVYGPNKSTLTAWDSISLAWKSDRLSLVVNDTEACYIENPGLPTAFGSYLFIGTDRNGANAINTLVDELRVDKVYKEVAIRTAWHKTGTPFYTSEDMKQWPGYIRIVTDGVEVYDSSGNLRVKLGSWLKDLLREYGLKVVGGLIMTGEGANRMEFNENGLVGIANNVPRIKMNANDVSSIGYIEFYNSNGDYSGYIGADDLRIGIYGMTPDIDMDIAVVPGAGKKVLVNGSITITGNVLINGNYTATGSKAAVQLTDDYGIRYLYAVEAPEILFYDRGVTNLVNGEATIQFDPIFLECIEPDTELTPWQIWVECYGENDVKVAEIGANYFKVKERNGGTSNNKVIWRLEAVRRNYAGIRLMEEVID